MFSNQKHPNLKYCIKCDFSCSKNSDFVRHLSTDKHKNIKKFEFSNQICSKKRQIGVKTPDHKCSYCSKEYKSKSGLWYHKKVCKNGDLLTHILKENQEFKDLMLEQQKQNHELARLLIENKCNSTIITNNNCNNTTNKFNLNLFLNEKCKDAINFVDFVNSLQLKLSDLEITAKLGYVEGISKIFVNGLKELDLYKRPVHCSDIKREILYIKDEDKWSKENEENQKMKIAIQNITKKNINQIPIWAKENPTCNDSTSKKNDEYMNIIYNCMSGISYEEQQENINKIIANVAQEVSIQK